MKIYEKSISLNNKVYTWDNILDIFELIEKQKNQYNNADFDIDIFCDDNFKITFNSIAEINEQKSIFSYKITKITAYLRSSYISIYFNLQNSSIFQSEIIIKSSNEILFNSLINQFSEIIKNIKKQKFGFVHTAPLLTLLALYIFNLFSSISFLRQILTGNFGIFVTTLKSILFFSFATIFAIVVLIFFQKAYPIVEFDFIPDKKNIAKKVRKWSHWICVMIILPLLLSGIFEVVKKILSMYGR